VISFALVEIHHQLVEVLRPHVMSKKEVWIWCSAFIMPGQKLITSSNPDTPCTLTVVDLYAMQMHLPEKTRHTTLTDISQELEISLDHAHSIIMTKCIMDSLSCILHVTVIKESSF